MLTNRRRDRRARHANLQIVRQESDSFLRDAGPLPSRGALTVGSELATVYGYD